MSSAIFTVVNFLRISRVREAKFLATSTAWFLALSVVVSILLYVFRMSLIVDVVVVINKKRVVN